MLTYTEYTLTWHAVRGNTPRVQPPGIMAIPGKYTVELTVDGHTYKQDFTLTNDPRVPVTQEQLAAQFESEKVITAGMATSYDGYYVVDRMRKVLAANEARLAGKPNASEVTAAIGSLSTQLSQLADGEFGFANRDLTRHLEDADFGDLLPTESNLAAVQANCRQIDAALAELHRLRTTTIPQLNTVLEHAQLTPLPLGDGPSAPSCGVAHDAVARAAR